MQWLNGSSAEILNGGIVTILGLQGVDQSTPMSSGNSTSATASSASTAVTTVAGDFVASTILMANGTLTIPSDHTTLDSGGISTVSERASTYEVATTTTTTMDYTFDSSLAYVHST